MALSRIVMRLARNPGTEFADGDDRRGYTLTAPLTDDGMIDEGEYGRNRDGCTVRRFQPDDDAQMGLLKRRSNGRWFFDYDDEDQADDEDVHRLGEHRFTVGEYVSVAGEDGRPLAYKVVEVTPV